MSKWGYTHLINLCEIQIGEQRDKQNQKEYLFINGNIPLIDGSALRGKKLYILGSNRYYNKKALRLCKLFPKETVCLTCIGSCCGDCALLKYESCLSNSVLALNCYENLSSSKFIKYFFDSNEIKNQIKSLSYCSTAQPSLSIEKINFLKIPNLSYEVQTKIGNTLSSYDELIEALEEKIELLEIIRDSFYKEWFIKLRFPNYVKHTSINSLPKSWKFMKLKDISEINKGSKPAGYAIDMAGGGQKDLSILYLFCWNSKIFWLFFW